jgi:hypothetical protein
MRYKQFLPTHSTLELLFLRPRIAWQDFQPLANGATWQYQVTFVSSAQSLTLVDAATLGQNQMSVLLTRIPSILANSAIVLHLPLCTPTLGNLKPPLLVDHESTVIGPTPDLRGSYQQYADTQHPVRATGMTLSYHDYHCT